MEHQQHVKQVPYDGSSSVPLIIYDPRRRNKATTTTTRNTIVRTPSQHIDLFPTILDLIGIQDDIPNVLDGYSLVPLMTPTTTSSSSTESSKATRAVSRRKVQENPKNQTRPDFVVSQYHGDSIAMSWFLIVQPLSCPQDDDVDDATSSNSDGDDSSTCLMKLVVWGTGQEVDSQLFDLTHDPGEMVNLIHHSLYANTITTLETNLKSVVDYEQVAKEVAQYNQDSFRAWTQHTADWKDIVQGDKMSWHVSWQEAGDGPSMAAIEEWLSQPPNVAACRKDLVWPPSTTMDDNSMKTAV